MLVLNAISGPDPGDVASVPSQLDFDAAATVKGLRVGYIPRLDERSPRHRRRSRRARNRIRKLGMAPVEVTLPDWPYGSPQPHPLRRSRRRLRRAHPLRGSSTATQGAGCRRLAQHLPPVPLSLRGGFRPGRPLPPHGRPGDGAHLVRSRRAPRALSARRDPHHHQLHRLSVAHPTRGLRRSLRGPQRLGARPRPSRCRNSRRPAAYRTASPSRPALRRRHHRPRRPRPRTITST